MGSQPRLFVDAALTRGAEIALVADQTHRLLHVRRAGRGAILTLFNGRDGEWRAELAETGKKRAVLLVSDRLRAQTVEPGPSLLFAPLKRGPLDWLVEKATELGVESLRPVWTRRTDSHRVGIDRLRAIAVEAAEQCGRLTVPGIEEPQPLDALDSHWPAARQLVVLDESGGGRAIRDVLSQPSDAPPAFLIGPEGGFAQSELDAVKSLSFAVAADLGPRILRAETAAIAALACWQALRGGKVSASPSPTS